MVRSFKYSFHDTGTGISLQYDTAVDLYVFDSATVHNFNFHTSSYSKS